MLRTSVTDAFQRLFVSRGTVREFDDKHLVQEVKFVDGFHSQTHSNQGAPLERWQDVGHTATPLKQNKEQGQQGQQTASGTGGGGGGQTGEANQDGQFNHSQPKGKGAEAIILYVNGHQAHPVVFCDDRRVRPYKVKEGCAAQYTPDNNGSMIYHDKDKGTYHVVTNNPSYDPETGKQSGQEVKRSAYVRHAKKDIQERQISSQQQGGSSGGSQQQSGQQQEVKHQGKHINSEHEHHDNGLNHSVDYDEEGGQKKTVHSYKVKEKEHKWDVNAEGKVTRVMNSTDINDKSDNHYVNANQALSQQSGQSSSYSAGSSLFVGGSSTHVHGQIIAEPINLGHFDKTSISAAFQEGITEEERIELLDGAVGDTGMTMTTSVSQATPPSNPDLGVPYNGFRWIDTTSGIEYSYYQGIWAEGGGAIAFPASPALNQVFTFQSRQWKWNGIGWQSILTSVNPEFNVGGATQTPASNSGLMFELTNNTTLKIKVKGTDGTVRSVSLTLA